MPAARDVRHLEEQLRHTHQRARLLRGSMIYSSVSIFFVTLTILSLFAEQVFQLHLDFVALPFFALCLISLVISISYSIRDITVSLAALEMEMSSVRATARQIAVDAPAAPERPRSVTTSRDLPHRPNVLRPPSLGYRGPIAYAGSSAQRAPADCYPHKGFVMPLVNAFSKAVVRDFSLEELEQAARLMRGYDLVALCAAGSGHAGGTLSMMEIVAALYLKVANHDPNNPEWPQRDRIIWSAGHKAPALYLGLAFAGYFPIEDVVTLRKLYSPFQGHPHRLKLPGVEVSSGSLGQGLSIAVGMAMAGKLDHDDHTVFCIMGDGEQQEGNIWEAAMEASHYKLDNLVGIIDRNRLQIDGWVKDVMNVEPLPSAIAASAGKSSRSTATTCSRW